MRCAALALGLAAAVLLAPVSAGAAPVTLKNDTYTGSSATLAVQGGFASGESYAVVLVPTGYPFHVQKVQILIAPGPGGSSSTNTYQLTIYQDTAGSKTPGTQLYDQAVQIQSSTSAISEIDVSSDNVLVTSGNIRVRCKQNHKGTPSIVRDNGPRKAKSNLIHGNIGLGSNWYWLEDLDLLGMKIAGNWIIRAVGEVKGGTPDGGTTTPDMKVLTPDAGVQKDSASPQKDTGATQTDGAPTQKDTGVTQKDTGVTQKDTGVTQKDAGGMGSEGQKCYPNGTCNAGLTCLSNLCVQPPPADDGCAVAREPGRGVGHGALLALLALALCARLRRRS